MTDNKVKTIWYIIGTNNFDTEELAQVEYEHFLSVLAENDYVLSFSLEWYYSEHGKSWYFIGNDDFDNNNKAQKVIDNLVFDLKKDGLDYQFYPDAVEVNASEKTKTTKVKKIPDDQQAFWYVSHDSELYDPGQRDFATREEAEAAIQKIVDALNEAGLEEVLKGLSFYPDVYSFIPEFKADSHESVQ